MAECVRGPYRKFDARAYISEYYACVGKENRFLLEFYHDVYSRLPTGLRVLECGGGPTVYQLFSASRKATEIVFTDYLPENLREVAAWLRRDPRAFSWERFAHAVAALEGSNPLANTSEVRAIEERTRASISQMIWCDALTGEQPAVLERMTFDVVSSGFCLECIGEEEAALLASLKTVLAWVVPGGYVVLTMLKNSSGYHVGDFLFPAVPLNAEKISTILEAHACEILDLREVAAEKRQGYEGLIALLAQVRP